MSEAETKVASSNRKFYLLVAVFLLAAVLTGVLPARRSKSSVEQWKDEMRAKGERFTVVELLGKRAGPVTNRLDELVRLGVLLGTASRGLSGIDHFRYLSNGLAEAAWMRPRLGLSAAAPGATAARGVPSSVAPYEWEDLAAEMAAMETTLAEVHALLAVPDRDTGWDYQHRTPMPKYFVEKRHLAQWLAAANTHTLHERQSAQAVAHLTGSCNLVAWHAEDFSIIGQMIRVAIGNLALQSTWATMQAPGVTEAQLAGLQARWEGLLIMPALARAMEFERAGIGQLFTQVRSGQESVATAFGPVTTGGGKFADQAASLVWRALGAEADELFYLRFMQGQIGALRKLARLRSWTAAQPDLATNSAQLAVFDTWQGKLLLLSQIGLPNFSRAIPTALRYETLRELTITAMAVERFRRKHGCAPAALSDLVPGFLPAVPVDWMDGKPVRYRLNADGVFTLWSIGEDFKDDGGDPTPVAGGSQQNPFWERRDVVWPSQPP